MFLILEILFIVLLVMIFYMVFVNERISTRDRLPQATLEEYWGGKERRRYVRFKKTIEMTYTVSTKISAEAVNGKTLDISQGGIKLLLCEKLPVGTILCLKLYFPDSKKTAEARGEVVWSEDKDETDQSGKRFFHSGIRFSAIKDPSYSYLAEYIRSIAADPQA